MFRNFQELPTILKDQKVGTDEDGRRNFFLTFLDFFSEIVPNDQEKCQKWFDEVSGTFLSFFLRFFILIFDFLIFTGIGSGTDTEGEHVTVLCFQKSPKKVRYVVRTYVLVVQTFWSFNVCFFHPRPF